VQKVVQLLDNLKAKVSDELATEEKLMEEYTKWCDSEANSKEDAIRSAKRTIGDLQATIEDSSASIDGLTTEVSDLAAKISTNEADLASATKIRESEHAAFTANEKELVDTIDTLSRAQVVLKRGQTSFLQNRGSKALDALASGLSKIVEASWVNSHEKSVVRALLQSGDEDEDLSLQPQATVSAYDSHGAGILDVLADLQAKAEASLSDARKEEMSSRHSYDMLKQGLTDELRVMNARRADASSQKSNTEEAKHVAAGDLAATQDGKATDEAYLSDLQQSCAAKSRDWETRQKDAAEEMAAIAKAKEILESGVKAFMQVSATARDDEQDMKRDQISKILSTLAKKEGAFALAQLALEAKNDPFVKVRGLIETMIEKLTKEAAEEAGAKSFCDAEIAESKAKQAKLSQTVDRHTVRIEKSEAAKAKLQDEIRTLNEEVAAINQGQAEATSLRQKESEQFAKASSDYKQSIDAVASAVQVLQEYYNGAFVQVRQGQPEFGSAKGDVANTIVEMLEVAESDFTRLLTEAETEENSAASSYKKLTQQNAVTKASKEQEIKGKTAETKSLEVALMNYNEDRESTSKELDAVLTYLDKLKPQCETKVMTYAERKAKREEEIAGLKEALTILEG